MFKERLHKFKEELKDEAKRINKRMKEELLESDADEAKDSNRILPN